MVLALVSVIELFACHYIFTTVAFGGSHIDWHLELYVFIHLQLVDE